MKLYIHLCNKINVIFLHLMYNLCKENKLISYDNNNNKVFLTSTPAPAKTPKKENKKL